MLNQRKPRTFKPTKIARYTVYTLYIHVHVWAKCPSGRNVQVGEMSKWHIIRKAPYTEEMHDIIHVDTYIMRPSVL